MTQVRDKAIELMKLSNPANTGWEDVDDKACQVKIVPEYDLSNIQVLVEQLIQQFTKVDESTKTEVKSLLLEKFRDLDFTNRESGLEQLRDFIYEMF